MFGHDDFHVHFAGALQDRVKVVDLEPQQHTVSVGLVLAIADGAVMVVDHEAVQLHNELAIPEELLIRGTAVTALATEEALIPAAAGFHIRDGNERLGAHGQ